MQKIIQTTALYLLLFMWVYAAASKLSVLTHFSLQIRQMPWIGEYYSALSWAVPGAEIVIVFLLLLHRRIGAVVSVILLSCFTIYIIFVLRFAPSVPCSCGGIISKLTWQQHIVFNLFFILLSIVLLIKDLPFGRRKQGYAENLITE